MRERTQNFLFSKTFLPKKLDQDITEEVKNKKNNKRSSADNILP